jgi:thiamine biosynthesis lipoprotein
MSGADVSFRAMGSDMRLIIESGPDEPEPARAAAAAREFIERFEACLSRFRPRSELCALNADPRAAVPASLLMRDAVRAALSAAETTGGLVDPTLVDEIEAAGYARSREGVASASLVEALAFAPARRPASPRPAARWRELEVDEAFGVIRRPPGVRFDSGGIGKGLAADLLAERLRAHRRFVVDCGGDLRVGGADVSVRPVEVLVEHPLSRVHTHSLDLDGGAVATSGLNIRVWRRADGRFAHHLLDPATGEPAWTGLVGATALAPTAAAAETLAKAALLSGPEGAPRVLGDHGGLVVHEDGEVEPVGPISVRPRYSISVPAPAFTRQVAA